MCIRCYLRIGYVKTCLFHVFFVLQDLKSGKVDNAFILNHEQEELAKVRSWNVLDMLILWVRLLLKCYFRCDAYIGTLTNKTSGGWNCLNFYSFIWLKYGLFWALHYLNPLQNFPCLLRFLVQILVASPIVPLNLHEIT